MSIFQPHTLQPHAPIMSYPEQTYLSPNRRMLPSNERLGLVLHHCGGWAKTGDPRSGSIAWCLNPASQVSYHCIIAWDGTRTILVPDDQQAWHAGRSRWRDRSNCNAFTLGLAFGGDTVTGARRPDNFSALTEPELQSLREWLQPRIARYNWTLDSITTHRHVSPGRKNDISINAEIQVQHAIADLFNG